MNGPSSSPSLCDAQGTLPTFAKKYNDYNDDDEKIHLS